GGGERVGAGETRDEPRAGVTLERGLDERTGCGEPYRRGHRRSGILPAAPTVYFFCRQWTSPLRERLRLRVQFSLMARKARDATEPRFSIRGLMAGEELLVDRLRHLEHPARDGLACVVFACEVARGGD